MQMFAFTCKLFCYLSSSASMYKVLARNALQIFIFVTYFTLLCNLDTIEKYTQQLPS